MATPIRVLILEDRPADADLIVSELRRAGFDPDVRRVDTETGFTAALDASLDLILADYQLPGWNGIKALVVLKASGLDIPFIIVSGTIGEDIAVAAMRNGAEDFLIKDRLARLGPAVKQSLERKCLRAERQQAEKELRRSEERFRDLFENANDLIQSVRPDGTFLYVNRAWREALGYSAEEVAGLSMQDIIDPSCMSHCMAMFQRVLAGEKLPRVEAMFRTKDGRTIHLEGSSNCRFEDGQPVSTRSIFRDITERKQAAEVLQRTERLYRSAIAAAGAVPYDYDYQTRTYLFIGEGIEQLTGYRPEEISGPLWRQIIQESVMLGEAAGLGKDDAAQRVLRGEIRHWRSDMRIITRDGKTRWLSDVSVQKLDDAGRVIGSTGILQDITERKKAEVSIRKLNRTYAVWSAINQLIVRERDPQTILDGACRIAVEKGGLRLALITSPETQGDGLKLAAHAGASPDTLAILGKIFAAPRRQASFTSKAFTTGVHSICNDIEHDPQAAPWREAALKRGYRSSVMLPLKSGKSVIGTFNLYAGEPGFFDADEMALLDELARDISFALEVTRQETQRREAEEALKQRAADLERFHRLSVGRELQMIELKKEVNEFAALAGRIPPHDLSFLERQTVKTGSDHE